jgi:hypothetical protein
MDLEELLDDKERTIDALRAEIGLAKAEEGKAREDASRAKAIEDKVRGDLERARKTISKAEAESRRKENEVGDIHQRAWDQRWGEAEIAAASTPFAIKLDVHRLVAPDVDAREHSTRLWTRPTSPTVTGHPTRSRRQPACTAQNAGSTWIHLRPGLAVCHGLRLFPYSRPRIAHGSLLPRHESGWDIPFASLTSELYSSPLIFALSQTLGAGHGIRGYLPRRPSHTRAHHRF